jgi:hypothetical protein
MVTYSVPPKVHLSSPRQKEKKEHTLVCMKTTLTKFNRICLELELDERWISVHMCSAFILTAMFLTICAIFWNMSSQSATVQFTFFVVTFCASVVIAAVCLHFGDLYITSCRAVHVSL